MFLSSICIKNIRKHTETSIDFTDKLNYIVGGNGVGKTTILEAIYYLCTTKSCVTSQDLEAVRMGEKGFSVNGKFSGLTDDDVQVNYSATENKKTILLSNKQIHRFSDIIGKFPVVLISPSDHSITQGYPAERRRFIDSVISQASRTYLNLLLEYNRILKQRSNLLLRIKETKREDNQETHSWNEKLIQVGTEIIKHRDSFVNEYVPYIRESYNKILGSKEKPGVKYYFLEGNCSEDIEKCFSSMLEEKKDDEIRRATNLVGPHRDEYIFEINGLNLKSYGSQGQNKTFQAVLRFAEYFYLKDKTGTAPAFLLDDVFGELDAERATAISNYLSGVGQAFITLTDFGNISFLNRGKGNRIINLSEAGNITYA